MAINWTQKTPEIAVGESGLRYTSRWSGPSSPTLRFRVDARGGKVRLDVATPLSPMWEAIDNGEPFASPAEAKKFVKTWMRAVRAQGTLTPSVRH